MAEDPKHPFTGKAEAINHRSPPQPLPAAKSAPAAADHFKREQPGAIDFKNPPKVAEPTPAAAPVPTPDKPKS